MTAAAEWCVVHEDDPTSVLEDVEIHGDADDVGVTRGTLIIETWTRARGGGLRLDFAAAASLAATIDAHVRRCEPPR